MFSKKSAFKNAFPKIGEGNEISSARDPLRKSLLPSRDVPPRKIYKSLKTSCRYRLKNRITALKPMRLIRRGPQAQSRLVIEWIYFNQ